MVAFKQLQRAAAQVTDRSVSISDGRYTMVLSLAEADEIFNFILDQRARAVAGDK